MPPGPEADCEPRVPPPRRGGGPSPLASHPTLTPAALANATRRSRLGSASPRSHLRNADGETPVALANRSALGQWRTISCRRAMKAPAFAARYSAPGVILAASLLRDIRRAPFKVSTLLSQEEVAFTTFRAVRRCKATIVLWRECGMDARDIRPSQPPEDWHPADVLAALK